MATFFFLYKGKLLSPAARELSVSLARVTLLVVVLLPLLSENWLCLSQL